MSDSLLTPNEIADRLRVPVERFMDLRRSNNWPHVRVGRSVRFTEAQYQHILTVATIAQSEAEPADTGISAASKARRGL